MHEGDFYGLAGPSDLEGLRVHGLGDTGILELVHIIGYFNHINRLADALGVELEDFMAPRNSSAISTGGP